MNRFLFLTKIDRLVRALLGIPMALFAWRLSTDYLSWSILAVFIASGLLVSALLGMRLVQIPLFIFLKIFQKIQALLGDLAVD